MAKKTDNRYFGDPKGARARRKLYGQLEKLEGDILLEKDLILLKENQLKQQREKKLLKRDRQLKKALYKEELLLASPEEAALELTRKRLERMQKAQRLAYRMQRQQLRREEGIVDKAGRVLAGKQLSAAAQQRLDALLVQQEKEREDYVNAVKTRVAASRLAGPEKERRQAAYQAALQNKEEELAKLEEQLINKDQQTLAAYAQKQNARIEKQTRILKQKQAEIIESDSHAEHNLPEDVVLRLDALSMNFGGLKAVDNLSFDVKKGEIFGLIGPNGAGKTTVFNCITQFYKPTSGNILYRTHEGNVLRLNNYQVHEIITKGIVRTFQNVEVIAELSILDNLLIAAHKQFRSNLFLQMLNTGKVRKEEEVIRQRALKVLDYCGLSAIKDLPPVGQPYGVLKRIELARTLMAGANLIILDEPAAGLNDQETIELTHMIRRIQKDYEVTIFLVEHNMGLVMDLCDHICAISFGRKLAYGTPRDIQNNALVQEAYLGFSEESEKEQDHA